jgi:hypothetical protein
VQINRAVLAAAKEPDIYMALQEVMSKELLGSTTYAAFRLVGKLHRLSRYSTTLRFKDIRKAAIQLPDPVQTAIAGIKEASESEVDIEFLMEYLGNRAIANKGKHLIDDFLLGEDIDLTNELGAVIDDISASRAQIGEQADIVSMLDPSIFDDITFDGSVGFPWPWAPLDAACRPALPGDFICLAGRPDAAKTSMLFSLLVYWLRQTKRYGNTGRIAVFVNEGSMRRASQRMHHAILERSTKDIKKKGNRWFKKQLSKHTDLLERIEFIPAHGERLPFVLSNLTTSDYDVVVIDQISNLVPDEGSAAEVARKLGRCYAALRVEAVKRSQVIIGTIQLAARAENVAYPTMSMLDSSRTAVQATLDLLITIGRTMDNPNFRYIGTPKNKLAYDEILDAAEITDPVHADLIRCKFWCPDNTDAY